MVENQMKTESEKIDAFKSLCFISETNSVNPGSTALLL